MKNYSLIPLIRIYRGLRKSILYFHGRIKISRGVITSMKRVHQRTICSFPEKLLSSPYHTHNLQQLSVNGTSIADKIFHLCKQKPGTSLHRIVDWTRVYSFWSSSWKPEGSIRSKIKFSIGHFLVSNKNCFAHVPDVLPPLLPIPADNSTIFIENKFIRNCLITA